ncbi:4-hydroxyphenylpyruvate dioxygenase [Actinokineospora diospyrosa]|uniref:4-hydroxymandelate synthase n=1 Tax=Actinokineospora diospyrosa TaxID=103728 RepID=A0ABT1IM54_9PSEU|nr:4-hydroxyphenylpyruvate dioxygenase [Actinokineospora diospyrosa]MCP2273731.1 4-hydroxymandelate synthase [Actinokineospora diospyrosa]
MDIQDIDHVELYVGDVQQSAFYLCTALGFRVAGQGGPETSLPDDRSLLLRHGRIQLLLTSGLNPRSAAAQYVARHGDGVSSLAFTVADAKAAFAEAVGRGATAVAEPVTHTDGDTSVTIAEVIGFGDVRHRFIERRGERDEFLPGVIGMLTHDVEEGDSLLDIVDHIAVCLPAGTLAPTVQFYKDVFDFEQIFEEYIEIGDQAMDSKVVQSKSTKVTFTLIEPDSTRRPGQIDDFLARHDGAGVQHLAFLTDDIVGSVETFAARGVQFLSTPASYYDALQERLGRVDLGVEALRRTNVLVDRDHWGEVFQIFTRSIHARGTYFLEVIDRHGAKTFGSGNIRALYEAVLRASESPATAG